MSLTFHSIELFLKGAILQKASSEKFSGRNGHDLGHLYSRYTNLYPGKAYAIEFPFKREVPDIEGMDPQLELADELLALSQQLEKTMPEDQMHRYPSDRNSKPWKALLGFEPHSFMPVLKKLKADFIQIRSHM